VDESARRKVIEYVKPLAVGLDGMTYSGDVERVAAIARAIAGARSDVDAELLDLLAVFSGQKKWVERMGHGSRTQIFLESLGVPAARIRALFRGLARLEGAPSTPEEDLVHDALCIDEMGAIGVARLAQQGYRERLTFEEMADRIEEAARPPLRTPAGEALAAERRAAMRAFARKLRAESLEFSGVRAPEPASEDPGA